MWKFLGKTRNASNTDQVIADSERIRQEFNATVASLMERVTALEAAMDERRTELNPRRS